MYFPVVIYYLAVIAIRLSHCKVCEFVPVQKNSFRANNYRTVILKNGGYLVSWKISTYVPRVLKFADIQ